MYTSWHYRSFTIIRSLPEVSQKKKRRRKKKLIKEQNLDENSSPWFCAVAGTRLKFIIKPDMPDTREIRLISAHEQPGSQGQSVNNSHTKACNVPTPVLWCRPQPEMIYAMTHQKHGVLVRSCGTVQQHITVCLFFMAHMEKKLYKKWYKKELPHDTVSTSIIQRTNNQ